MAKLIHRLPLSGWGLAALLLWCSLATITDAQPLNPEKYALLIGIDEYLLGGIQGVNPLQFAVKDAKALEQALKARGWRTSAVVAGEATRERIVRELYGLALKAKLHDKVLVYFAGHGVRDPISSGSTYWLTYDAEISSLVAKGIRLNHIMEHVREIPATQKIILLDHCYSGDIELVAAPGPAADGDRRLAVAATELNTEHVSRALYPPDIEDLRRHSEDRMVVLGAARGPAYEHPDWGHGMFTKAILDVLGDASADSSSPKDGKISLTEFWTQVSSRMQSLASSKQLQQSPFGTEIKLEQMEWALFDAAQDAGSEAAELSAALSDLDMLVPLPTVVKWEVLDVVATWSDRQRDGLDQSPKHLRIIEELRALRDHGVSDRPERKRTSLIELLVRLEIVDRTDVEDSE